MTSFEGVAPELWRSSGIVLPLPSGNSFAGGAGRVSPLLPPQPARSAAVRAARASRAISRDGIDREVTSPPESAIGSRHAEHLRAELRGTRRATRFQVLPRPRRLRARQPAHRRQHVETAARRGRLPVPLPLLRRGAPLRLERAA